jgi:hypothetical protein
MANQNFNLKLTLTQANRLRETLRKRRDNLMKMLPHLDDDEKQELGEINDLLAREFDDH